MSHIFISYSRKDEEFARKLARSLSDEGAEIWMDVEDIAPGMKWSTAIQQGLNTCDVMLLILSPASIESTNVEDEWHYFLDKRKPLIPILWHPAEIPYQLTRIQRVDFHNQAYDKALDGLMVALQNKGAVFELNDSKTNRQLSPRSNSNPQDIQAILPDPFEWCEIPAGKVAIEYSGSDHQTFDVLTFEIAKYPITYAQYQVFLDSDTGYSDPLWWTYSEYAQLWRKNKTQPEKFGNMGEHMPRSNVSWYDAMAFCQWLSYLTGESIMLPTEQQWQRAAQGDDGRIYPWGNEQPDTSRCNNGAKLIDVTAFPDGSSPFGVMDMYGNVWEWILNKIKERNTDLNGEELRARRGGGGSDDQITVRGSSKPNSQVGYVGFRIARLR